MAAAATDFGAGGVSAVSAHKAAKDHAASCIKVLCTALEDENVSQDPSHAKDLFRDLLYAFEEVRATTPIGHTHKSCKDCEHDAHPNKAGFQLGLGSSERFAWYLEVTKIWNPDCYWKARVSKEEFKLAEGRHKWYESRAQIKREERQMGAYEDQEVREEIAQRKKDEEEYMAKCG